MTDSTVALVCDHYFTPPADVGVSGGQCHHCGTSAWDVIERQQRELEARDARIAVLERAVKTQDEDVNWHARGEHHNGRMP
jgi:hypothetical protein